MTYKFFILTGEPGVGKTTLVKKITSILKDKGVNMSGFYTEEVKKNKVREGFDVVSLDGTRGSLARERRIICRRERVGKYSITVEEFEKTAMPTLANVSVGKTTLVKKITSILKDKGVNMSGFYTEEVKKNKVREGFDVVSLDGTRGSLARERRIICRRERVGKYSITVEEFEKTAMPTLANMESSQTQLLVIDEIGKMECLSAKFREKIKEIFNSSSTVVLATVPVRDSDQIMGIIRNHNLSKLWVVTRENRDNILKDVAKKIECTLNTQ